MTSNDTLNTIKHRTSIRNYKDDKIPQAALEEIVKAGMAAPSAMNIQPWEFIIVTDKAVLEELAQVQPYVKMAKQAAAAIIVCGNMQNYGNGGLAAFKDYWVQDTSAASQNILLAADSMGIGSVWTGLFPSLNACAKVRKVLAIPEDVIPLNIIVLGYPLQETAPKNKWSDKKLHWNKY